MVLRGRIDDVRTPLHVDLFQILLTDVGNVEVAVGPIEGEAPGVAGS